MNYGHTCTYKGLQILSYIFIYISCVIATSKYLQDSEFPACFNSSVPLPMSFVCLFLELSDAFLHSTAHLIHSQILLDALPTFFYTIVY